jgi:P-type Ca2+ transporter type 2C
LTVTVAAVGLAFVSSICSPEEQSVLSVVQLLWLNLIQDTFAALALATDPPTLDLLNRKPEKKDASIISPTMWKMIMGQSALQLIVTFILVFAGPRLFPAWSALELETVVFNTFSLLQVSNQINCRRIDSKFNVFVGIHRNWLFIGITLITLAGQVLIVNVGGVAFSVTRLNGIQWLVSILLGTLSLPVGALIRLVPIPSRWTSGRSLFWRIKRSNSVSVIKGKLPAGVSAEMAEFHSPILARIQTQKIGTKAEERGFIGRFVSHKRNTSSPVDIETVAEPGGSSLTKPNSAVTSSNPECSTSPTGIPQQPSETVPRGETSISGLNFAMLSLPVGLATSIMSSLSAPTNGHSRDQLPQVLNRRALEDSEGIEFHRDTKPGDPIVGKGAETFGFS